MFHAALRLWLRVPAEWWVQRVPNAAALLAHGRCMLAPSTPTAHACPPCNSLCRRPTSPTGSLVLLVDHLERQAARGRLAFGTGDAAADVMVAAARCARLRLFRLAHEYALAASGRRRQYAPEEGRAARRRRPIDSSEEEEEEEEAGPRGSGAAAAAAGGWPSDGSEAAGAAGGGGGGDVVQAGPAHAAAAATWQPSALQLFEVLRGAALGGCPAILRCILASPLPFSVAAADAQGSGLLAHCAAHAEEASCAESLALLHAAGAAASLKRLLYLLEKRMSAPCVAALLALQVPQVPSSDVTLKAGGVTSYTCPVNRLLHAWTVSRDERSGGRRLAQREGLAVARACCGKGLLWCLLLLSARRLGFGCRLLVIHMAPDCPPSMPKPCLLFSRPPCAARLPPLAGRRPRGLAPQRDAGAGGADGRWPAAHGVPGEPC